MLKAKKVKVISVIDPDTNQPIEVIIAKLENGAMIGIDASYVVQEEGPLRDPYTTGKKGPLIDQEDLDYSDTEVIHL